MFTLSSHHPASPPPVHLQADTDTCSWAWGKVSNDYVDMACVLNTMSHNQLGKNHCCKVVVVVDMVVVVILIKIKKSKDQRNTTSLSPAQLLQLVSYTLQIHMTVVTIYPRI